MEPQIDVESGAEFDWGFVDTIISRLDDMIGHFNNNLLSDRELAEAVIHRLDIIITILLVLVMAGVAVGFCYLIYKLILKFF